MINDMLKVDYALSYWFSKTKDKIVPGTVFLFLNKLTFFSTCLFLTLDRLLPNVFDTIVLVGGLIFMALLMMYVLQKPLEKIVNKSQLKKEYLKLEDSEVRKRRFVGILLFVVTFFSMFIPVLL